MKISMGWYIKALQMIDQSKSKTLIFTTACWKYCWWFPAGSGNCLLSRNDSGRFSRICFRENISRSRVSTTQGCKQLYEHLNHINGIRPSASRFALRRAKFNQEYRCSCEFALIKNWGSRLRTKAFGIILQISHHETQFLIRDRVETTKLRTKIQINARLQYGTTW